MTNIVIGFASQIAARGAALPLAGAASAGSLTISGAAVVRRDSEGGIHVDPLRELSPSLPSHGLLVLDPIVDGAGPEDHRLEPGQAALVVSVAGLAEGALESALREIRDGRNPPLWIDAQSGAAG